MRTGETNAFNSSLATLGEAPLGNAASEKPLLNNVAPHVSVMMLLNEIFFSVRQILNDRVQKIKDQIDARDNQIGRLGGIISNLESWENLSDNEKISQTDELILNGVIISDGKSDVCDFCKFKLDTGEVLYAPFPPEVLRGEPVNNTLYYSASKNEYLFYREGENSKTFFNVSSPLPLKDKTTPGEDFSDFSPGDLVRDVSTNKYYRVTNDGTVTEVQNFPLQKFISNPTEDRINDLQNRIRLRLNTVQNLSKGDGLELQTISGEINSNLTGISGLLNSLSTVLNMYAKNI